jgi:DNA-binding transcriptional MerR regulator
MIRFAQAVGLPLREIATIAAELQRQGLTPAREVELMDEALARLERKAAELAELTDYLRQKRDWVARGKPGNEPRFVDDAPCLATAARPA